MAFKLSITALEEIIQTKLAISNAFINNLDGIAWSKSKGLTFRYYDLNLMDGCKLNALNYLTHKTR